MKKFFIAAIIATTAFTNTVSANWLTDRLDDIGTIVGGHIDDFAARASGVNEVVEGTTVAKGDFRNDDVGQDFAHRTYTGSASVVRGDDGVVYIQISEDFESTIGPDFHVYVSTATGIVDEEGFKSSVQIELGKLKRSVGASYYPVPVDLIKSGDIKSVTVWCKRFSEFIGSADLTPVK